MAIHLQPFQISINQISGQTPQWKQSELHQVEHQPALSRSCAGIIGDEKTNQLPEICNGKSELPDRFFQRAFPLKHLNLVLHDLLALEHVEESIYPWWIKSMAFVQSVE